MKESQLDQPGVPPAVVSDARVEWRKLFHWPPWHIAADRPVSQRKGYFHRRKVTTLNALQSPAHVWRNTSAQQENCQPCVRINQPLVTRTPAPTRINLHMRRNSNKYLFTQNWWSSSEVEYTLFCLEGKEKKKNKGLIVAWASKNSAEDIRCRGRKLAPCLQPGKIVCFHFLIKLILCFVFRILKTRLTVQEEKVISLTWERHSVPCVASLRDHILKIISLGSTAHFRIKLYYVLTILNALASLWAHDN